MKNLVSKKNLKNGHKYMLFNGLKEIFEEFMNNSG